LALKENVCPKCGKPGHGPYIKITRNRSGGNTYHNLRNQQAELSGGKSLTSLEERMNRLLKRLGVPLRAAWLPSENPKEHSRIIPEERLVMVYDKDESEAWRSLFHEVLEYRFRGLISPYRKIINSLIEAIEEITYKEKERVLEQVMNDFSVWSSLEAERLDSANHESRKVKNSTAIAKGKNFGGWLKDFIITPFRKRKRGASKELKRRNPIPLIGQK